ncbi:beta-ketoacyl-ACP synthase II [Rubrobacter radiotolerans]|uniref:3-oxoacyl-[acyl-carrier-protein] synthase 2 n=1 Tax=Rubrobacter radiotolerans TaxID=42256 RepID=A0AB35T6L7_RUBRA|nr:beta-ketoacyl-ACP synthase II [Rubrobacter radiotolerans]MDX5895330.1 beta-ketoacyl-ACP synthase II [Rubrobacter radiotolerans]SMC01650.1 3-oxoacyl-[acyl-carrier-protein] synthase II [Rubrobacter radiotolerans DSM 5868]
MENVSRLDHRRVVITGCGAVSPLGLDINELWSGLIAGRSGIRAISRFDTADFTTKIAGEVHGFEPEQYISRKDARRMDLFTQYAVAAALQASEQAGLRIDDHLATRAGVIVGSGCGPSNLIQETVKRMLEQGPRRVSAYAAAATSVDNPSAEISMLLGAKGPSGALVTACATGNSCVGESMRAIQNGQADVMLAGGSDEPVTPMDVAQFSSAKVLSQRNDAPEKASRPFDIDRDGFVIGAGAGVVVLEEADHAIRRGAPILAELVGYGATTDAYHITAPDPTGAEAKRAMLMALEDARADPSEVDYVNAHGTGTRFNDATETRIVKSVLGERAVTVPISSTKSMTGHLIGAAATVELIATVYCILEGRTPPTINCDNPEDPDMNYVANTAQSHDVRLALNNSFGFGGHNAVLAIRRWEDT